MSALSRGVQVLQCFSTVDQELTSRELMARTGLPRPTLFRITNTLRRLNLLRYSHGRSTFAPGLGLLTMAAPVLARMTARQLARPMMQDLADHAAGQAMMTVGEDGKLVVVEVVQGVRSTVYRVEVGTRMSLSRTVTGRAFLLTATEEERVGYLRELAAVDTARAARVEAKLAETAADLAQKGYALDQSEYARELAGVAVPMRTPIDGQVVVFSCSVPTFVANEERLSDIGQRLANMVRNVEASIGHVTHLSHSGHDEPHAAGRATGG
jgi:DNA-binding IclR family transcriptional regulator